MVAPTLSVAILLLPLVSMFFRFVTLRGDGPRRATAWLRHRRSNHVVALIALAAWCTLWEFPLVAALPPVLFWILPILSTVVLEGGARYGDRAILTRTWTATDIMRLACWSTVAPPIALLMVAAGFHAIVDGIWGGSFWLIGAGIAAVVGPIQLQSAQGIKLRRVKSGTLYNRAFRLARKVGVNLDRVYVVPPGRGHLTNAFGLWRGIALTDNFGEYLSGPQLDFVIGHELGHVKGKHTRQKFSVILLVVVVLVLLSSSLSHMASAFRPVFMLIVLLMPLLAVYCLSRYFEYSCDREAIGFTNDPESGLHALVNLYRITGSPVKCGRIVELFMTHPSLTNRLEAIARAGQIPVSRAFAVLIEEKKGYKAISGCGGDALRSRPPE
jgi:Zn-dependent protease with chaperone function